MSGIAEPIEVTEEQRRAVREMYGVTQAERLKAKNTSLSILKRFAFYGAIVLAICLLFTVLTQGRATLVWELLTGVAATLTLAGLFGYLVANAIITGLKQ